MKPRALALADLHAAMNNLVDVVPVAIEPLIVGVVCTVKPPPPNMIDKTTGMAQFMVRLDRRSWEALKAVVDGYFLLQ